jgi:transposase
MTRSTRLGLLKAREMLVAQRTQLINALRGHLVEIGVIAAQGPKNARELAGVVMAEGDETIPACVRAALAPLVRQLHALDQRSRAAIEPSPRWFEATKWRAA